VNRRLQIDDSAVRLPVLLAAVATFMIVEAVRASRNERLQRARGGIEPPGDVYRWMQVAYPGVFAAMLAEGATGPPPALAVTAAGVLLFAFGKALKWWAIFTLGDRWTFRVIVVPGMPLATSGPYRLLRHPNYVGVIGELAGVALMAGAPLAGVAGGALFCALMGVRVRVENRAVDGILRRA
jgi:methyltransferase